MLLIRYKRPGLSWEHKVRAYVHGITILLISVRTDTNVGVIPMYHMYGTFVWLVHAARHHSKVISFPGFLPDKVLKAVQDYKVEYLHAVPPIVLFLVQSPLVKQYDLSSLKLVLCGGRFSTA
jgi:acyl-CoA synthetase (AMP-forming)/AMP-acid ligase II